MKEDQLLAEKIGYRIYFRPPPKGLTPSIILTELEVKDYSTADSYGADVQMSIQVWDRYKSSEDFAHLSAITARIHSLLHQPPGDLRKGSGTLSGPPMISPSYPLILSRILSIQGPKLDPDHVSLHTTLLWRCLLGLVAPSSEA